ncbi:DUF4427 domain-containing protein [Pseudomonas sp. s4]|uniref:DUF4427 domain-containing protein n=1 Tax=Pseudomonas sp. s4 TaxID=353218 RepID=UPI00398CC95C
MRKKIDSRTTPRIAHYFRDVDLLGNSCPEFIPEAFSSNCWYDGEQWPAHFLQRVAVRLNYIWATYGVRDGERTVHGSHPAVCCSSFQIADIIAVKEGEPPQAGAATQYALTFPLAVAENGGFKRVAHWSQGQAYLQDGTPLELNGREVVENQFRYVSAQQNLPNQCSEWRWPYPHNYRRAIAKINAKGLVGTTIPGLQLTHKKWSGIGVVVPTMVEARRLQYDILSLIDREVVSDTHFDHILVCEKLPSNVGGFDTEQLQAVFSSACFDFKSCLKVSDLMAKSMQLDFSSRVLILEGTTPKGPTHEVGGCWLCFQDNTHPYVRALVKAGRVKVNKQGRYMASLDELDTRRDLRERQGIAQQLAKELREQHGIESSFFSVLNSQRPDDLPFFSGRPWGGSYFITDSPDGDDE